MFPFEPHCVTIEQRSSHVQQNGYGEGSSQTFNAMPGTREQAYVPFVPLVGIEENAPVFCVDDEREDDDDVETSSAELASGDVSIEPQLGTGILKALIMRLMLIPSPLLVLLLLLTLINPVVHTIGRRG
ncbi:hypothetical protein L484_027149 [Morus notabilis]|uniref:Uncharacterized protein n=1 Tax=Morus notabilis TaxID=981085 RepID=W9S147_9ROSA|nr:hypothetical protein L484_027149 [Morus notabilis]